MMDLAILSGKMRKYYIRILLGDRVRVEKCRLMTSHAVALSTGTRNSPPSPNSRCRLRRGWQVFAVFPVRQGRP